MNIYRLKPLKALIIIFACAFLASTFACNSKSDKSTSTTFEEKPSTIVPNDEDRIDTSRRTLTPEQPKSTNESKSAPTEEPKAPEEKKIDPPLTPKICDPNFNLIGKPKANRYIYYVTGFVPGEFKCWNQLEAHGVQICQGEPCVIYYIDTPTAPLNTTPPHYIDPAILKAHGIGQFEHNNHWWEMKGAKLWGKTGKEFVYYNTNNNAGG